MVNNTTAEHKFTCNAGRATEYEARKYIDTAMVDFRGFPEEVSIVEWNDRNPMFDVRTW